MHITDDLDKEFHFSGHEIIHQFPISGGFSLNYNETHDYWFIDGVLPDGEDYELVIKHPLTEDFKIKYFELTVEFYNKCEEIVNTIRGNHNGCEETNN